MKSRLLWSDYEWESTTMVQPAARAGPAFKNDKEKERGGMEGGGR
jgi:hypothetical protein